MGLNNRAVLSLLFGAGSGDSRMKHWPRPPKFLEVFCIGLSPQTLIPAPKILAFLRNVLSTPKFSDPALSSKPVEKAFKKGPRTSTFPLTPHYYSWIHNNKLSEIPDLAISVLDKLKMRIRSHSLDQTGQKYTRHTVPQTLLLASCYQVPWAWSLEEVLMQNAWYQTSRFLKHTSTIWRWLDDCYFRRSLIWIVLR